jgi:Protein of unknown function (DUF998)
MTPIRWPVRAWLVAEIFFGLTGASAVLLSPAEAATNFAWPIRPPVAAAVIGAFYGSVAVMLVAALFAKWWEQVRLVVVAAALLTTLMLAATILHWDRFSVGTAPFALWLVSYVVPPPTLVALYIWQQRGACPGGESQPLPPWVRRLAIVNGAGLVVAWSVLFVFAPGADGPWPMSDLVVRVYAGWFISLGALLWLVGARATWPETRLATIWFFALPLLLLVQLSRFTGQVDWSNGWLLLILVDLSALATGAAWLWRRHELTPRGLAIIAAVGVGVFLVAIALVPLLRPELDVRARWVGEYARGPFGGLMVAAYFALGVGVLALAAALRARVTGLGGRIGAPLLGVAAIGAFAAAILPQDRTDAAVRTTAGTVRALLLIPVFLCLLTALVMLTAAFFNQPGWRPMAGTAALLVAAAVLALTWAILGPVEWRGLAGRLWDAAWAGWLLLTAGFVALRRTPARTLARQ